MKALEIISEVLQLKSQKKYLVIENLLQYYNLQQYGLEDTNKLMWQDIINYCENVC